MSDNKQDLNQEEKFEEVKVKGAESSEDRVRQRRVDELMQEREMAMEEEEQTLLRWEAAARPFKPRSREYFTTVGAIVILISVILMFAREFLLIAVVLALAFVAYVLASVEPEKVEHEVTSRGIKTGGKFFPWDALTRFWFEEKFGQEMVVVETTLQFPGQLLLLLGQVKKEEMEEELIRYLLSEKPEPTFLDKSASWLSKKVPLEE